jgi:membrane protease YdiL (CAAX protease family)
MKGGDPRPSIWHVLRSARRKPTVILLWAPVAIVTWRYFGSQRFYLAHLMRPGLAGRLPPGAEIYSFGAALVLFGLVSLLLIRVALQESVTAYGLTVGDWRFGLRSFVVLAPVMVALAAAAARNPEFLVQYPLWRGACASTPAFLLHAAAYLAYYLGFETFFRGFVQFGLRDDLGDWNAILVQTALSTTMHLGKPTGEIYGAVIGGIVFGALAFRTRSLLAVTALHWILGIALDLFICLR